MKFTVELQPAMQYLYRWLIPGIAGLALAVLCLLWYRHLLRKYPELRLRRGPVRPEKVPALRERYLRYLRDAGAEYRAGNLDERTAWQQISYLTRAFVYEASGIHVRELSLAEIRKCRLPMLEDLVETCYPPEFAPGHPVSPEAGFEKAREVIREWNSETRSSYRPRR